MTAADPSATAPTTTTSPTTTTAPSTAAARTAGPADFDAAFRELYPRSLGLAYRMLGNRAVSEDIASETMARAYVRWHQLDPDRRAGWVLRVTSNQAIDLLRRKGHVLEPGIIDLEDGTALRIALAAALAKLPRRQREAVTLRYLTDLSEAETARALGIGIGSVKTHTHRGLSALRVEFGESATLIERGAVHV